MELFESVEIEINHACDRACSYCPNSIGERIEKGHMRPELYEEIMRQLQELGFKGRIAYDFYNEPLLSKNIELFTQMTKHYLPLSRLEIFSNGTRLGLEKFRALRDLGVDYFVITKHEGLDHYLFDETWAQLSIEERMHVTYRTHHELNLTNRGGMLEVGPKKMALLPCQIPSFMLTISVKGNVIPCFEDFHQQNSMGNVLETPLMDIWNSERYLTFRSKLKKGLRHQFAACKDCNRLSVLSPSSKAIEGAQHVSL